MSIISRSPLVSTLSIAALALLSTACDRSFDVTWTVRGQPASEACAGLGERVTLVSEWRESPGAAPKRYETEAACADGTAKVNAGKDAQLIAELWRGETVVGSSTPMVLDGSATSPVNVDLTLHTGQLEATLEVAKRACGDAGATRFSVTLRADEGLMGRVIEEKQVSCEDGVAVYRHPAVRLGARYFVDAETTIGEQRYHVAGPGHAVLIDKPRTETTVNLRRVERQPGRDGGELGYTDGGEPLDAGDGADAGSDAGDESDAGETDADAGDADAGDDADAGTDAGVCVPDCAGKECGSDGCGGSCGTCTLGLCVVDQCVL